MTQLWKREIKLAIKITALCVAAAFGTASIYAHASSDSSAIIVLIPIFLAVLVFMVLNK